VTHPALSPIIAYSIDPSNPPCIAFPFLERLVDGQIVDGLFVDTLENVLRRCPELSPRHRLKYAVDVADGLSHLMVLDEHKYPITCMAVLSDGRLISGSGHWLSPGEIKVWQKPALISDSTTAEPAVNGDAQDAA
jgi:hypothetical protein